MLAAVAGLMVLGAPSGAIAAHPVLVDASQGLDQFLDAGTTTFCFAHSSPALSVLVNVTV